MSARALPVLMYHHVSPSPGLVTVSPQNFAEQVAWLARNAYRTVSCADLATFLDGRELPDRSVLITFDDGYLDNYIHAFPTLRRYGLHATVFAVTDWIGSGPLRPLGGQHLPSHRECVEAIQTGRADDVVMRWAEVEQTLTEGVFEFHSHTASHTRWDKTCRTPEAKSEALANDLARSRQSLQQFLGSTSAHLCWPQGYYDDDYLAVARALGYTHLYTTRPGTLRPNDDATRIPRIVVKDRGAGWLASRLKIYGSPRLARCYGWLKGH